MAGPVSEDPNTRLVIRSAGLAHQLKTLLGVQRMNMEAAGDPSLLDKSGEAQSDDGSTGLHAASSRERSI